LGKSSAKALQEETIQNGAKKRREGGRSLKGTQECQEVSSIASSTIHKGGWGTGLTLVSEDLGLDETENSLKEKSKEVKPGAFAAEPRVADVRKKKKKKRMGQKTERKTKD